MKMAVDGSLCRITKSAKDLINNVRILKIPDSQPTYRLAIIRPNVTDKESSEESDEEISEDESLAKIIENEVVADKKLDTAEKPNETRSEGVMRGQYRHNRQRPQHNRNKHRGRKNNFNKTGKNFKHLLNVKGAFEYGNEDFNSSANRDFSSKSSPNLAYKVDNFPMISPWLDPMIPNYQFLPFPQVTLPENSRGLLGDRPLCAPMCDQNSSYTPMASNFQSNTNNDAFNCESQLQMPMYSPMPSNSRNNFARNKNSAFPRMTSNSRNNFVHNQNSSFSHRTSNYPPNKQANNWNGGYNNYKNNQFRNKHSNFNNKRRQDQWNNKSRRHQNVRNNSSRNDY